MRLLLDSGVLFWWFESNPLLSSAAGVAISDTRNEVLVSAASVWEIGIKHRLGKLEAGALLEQVPQLFAEAHFTEMPILSGHALLAASLPAHHKDPFDRMLAAQAQAESLRIVSNDRIFDLYGVRRVW